MKIRVKPSPRSGERDKTFNVEYGGKRYEVGPKPVEVSSEAGAYLLSHLPVEVVEEQAAADKPEAAKPKAVAKPKSKKKKK